MEKTIKFKTFTLANAPHVVAPRQSLRNTVLVKHTGQIILSKGLYAAMGKPEKIEVLQDCQYPKDFYFRSSKDPLAFRVEASPKGQYSILSSTMSDIIAKPQGYSAPPLYLEVQGESKRRRAIQPVFRGTSY